MPPMPADLEALRVLAARLTHLIILDEAGSDNSLPSDASTAILSLLDELDRMREALAFYANKDDGGKHARAALSDETGI